MDRRTRWCTGACSTDCAREPSTSWVMARKTIRMLLLRAADSVPSMETFAELLDRLSFEPSRNNKLRLITEYFRTTPDPERGWALAALTGVLSFRYAKPSLLGALI